MYKITYVKIICIIFYLRLINSYISKEELLEVKNNYYARYYCKDEICTQVVYDYDDYVMEFPDINGNITNYIVYTCTNNDIELDKCKDEYMIDDMIFSLICNNDSECLSNKCYKNHCMYNNETPIVHCDNIYSDKWFLGKSSYMYCGKPPGDSCIENDECSSKNCRKNECQFQDDGPSDSDGVKTYIEGLIFFVILIVLVIIAIVICCCYFYKRIHKN